MKVEINLPQAFDKSVCFVKGHDWSAWERVPPAVPPKNIKGDPVAMRTCSRCGNVEVIKDKL